MRTLPPLYLITDGARVGERELLERTGEACRGGLTMVQVRERHLRDDDYVRVFRSLRHRVPPATLLIANRRLHLFDALGAVGVHVGGDPRAVAAVRERCAGVELVGYSAHSPGEVELAAAMGADYVSFSPIFPPSSKDSPLPPVGLDGIERVCRRAAVPVYALGGIGPENAADVKRAGAAGIAAVGAILDSPDPGAVVRSMLEVWRES